MGKEATQSAHAGNGQDGAGRGLGEDLRELPPLLTVADVARVLRKTPKAVYAMLGLGKLPGVVRESDAPRARVLILRDDLLSWIVERRAASSGATR